VHFGVFTTQVVSQVVVETDAVTGRPRRVAGAPVVKTDSFGSPVKTYILKSEEKGSDVNLASYLLRDAYRGVCRCAVIVSNDSDLLTPIRLAKSECGLTIGLVPPRAKGSTELKALADFKIDPRVHVLANSQFPDAVATPKGPIFKPAAW
jgi:uncharacterized LabA/DUF88 family protein